MHSGALRSKQIEAKFSCARYAQQAGIRAASQYSDEANARIMIGDTRGQTWEHRLHVFVTGGTGAIGSAVVHALIARGHRVVALARSDAAAIRLAGRGATPMVGDIAIPEAWVARLPRIDAVI